MKLNYLNLYALIAFFLVAGEVALEVRANHRGYQTLLFGEPSASHTGDTGSHVDDYLDPADEFGPTESFPFRSPVIGTEKPTEAIRVWFASSSYAEDTRFPTPNVFPNAAARTVAEALNRPVQMLNRSRAGYVIPSNIQHLNKSGKQWAPDLVLLYQMTNDLNQLSRPGLSNGPELEPSPVRFSLDLGDFLGRLYEQTTLFEQLSANVTPRLTAHRLLPDSLPRQATVAFRQRVIEFVAAAEASDAKPVLLTFAPRFHDAEKLTTETRYSLLRWNPYLSPEGFIRTLQNWNEAIRNIASEEGIPLIDLERRTKGKSHLYRDFVHLTREGHKEFAAALADGIIEILEEQGQ